MPMKIYRPLFPFLLLICLLALPLISAGCSMPGKIDCPFVQSPQGQTGSESRLSEQDTANDTQTDPAADASSEPAASEAFSTLCDDIFREVVSCDALTLRFEVADPSAFDLTVPDNGLGHLPPVWSSEDQEQEKKWKQQLEEIDRKSLSEEDAYTWDLLSYTLDESLQADREEFFYYADPLGSVSGAHTLLPVLLAEYPFERMEDVEQYLHLLSCFPSYFADIVSFEQKKAAAGLFMSDSQAERVISSCEDFIEDPEENLLLTSFEDKLDQLQDTTDTDENLIARNEELVKNSVIRAYEELITGIRDLKGTGSNENGLAYYERGKDYYQNLAKAMTGTDLEIREMTGMIEEDLNSCVSQVIGISVANKNVYEEMGQVSSADLGDPKEMIDTLRGAIRADFPDPPDVSYDLKYVPASLQDSMNPAFYLTAPLDRPDQHVIYLNPLYEEEGGLSTFVTLAHEGWPGHLYQHALFQKENCHPLRYCLNYDGWQEGWATYIEYQAYGWAALPEDAVRMTALNAEISMCAYARADIGIHYEGWKEEDVAAFLNEHGLRGDSAGDMCETIIGAPGSYLPYLIGCLQFRRLKDLAQEKAGEDFDLKSFHQYLLQKGPSPFPVLEEYMKKDGLL